MSRDHIVKALRRSSAPCRLVRGFQLTAGQRADLIAFLQSLTDEALLRDPRFANPWTTARAQ